MSNLNLEASDDMYAPEMYAGSIVSKLRKGKPIEDWEIEEFALSLEKERNTTGPSFSIVTNLDTVFKSIDESKKFILTFISTSREERKLGVTEFFENLKKKTKEINPLIVQEIADMIEEKYFS